MTKNDTTTVNGQLYDTQTGLPVAHATATPRPDRQAAPHKPATSLHGGTQKSKTLRRAQPKKPQPETLSPMVARRPQRRSLDIARHPHVKKVAPTPVKPSEVPDIAPRIARDVFLDGLGEGRGVAEGPVHEVVAHDQAAKLAEMEA